MTDTACFFCGEKDTLQNVFAENEFWIARWDNFPVSKGHAEIVLKRHASSVFDISDNEFRAALPLLGEVKRIVLAAHAPDGWNLGINDGSAAGQTVPHLHIHFIPRYAGDVSDPTGGVRNVIPGKGAYHA